MSTAVERAQAENRTVLGFWIYLMTDCVLFASLFATFAVMRGMTNGGPSGADLFSMPYALTETMILLASSFTCGLAVIAGGQQRRALLLSMLALTFVLGASFVGMEFHEFRDLALDGNSWHRSGFLSSYFTLVATHGLHICVGLLWLLTLSVQIVKKGLAGSTARRLTLFSMFWHFLDLVWIFIFSVVYLWSGRV